MSPNNNNPHPPTGPNPEEPSEMQPETASFIANYVPRLEPIEAAAAAEVLPTIREWVTAIGPKNTNNARCMLRAASVFAVWGLLSLGTRDTAVLFIPHNVDYWLHRVNAHKPDSWRRSTRSALHRVCRVANPHAWAAELTPLARAEVAAPYGIGEEQAFARSARLPGRRDRAARLWVACSSLGCGLYAREAARVLPEHITETAGGRLIVRVGGRHPRVVPIRREWTAVAHETLDEAKDNRFIHGRNPESGLRQVAVRIFDNPAVSPSARSLSWFRARNTWLLAHLRAGTPAHALRLLGGNASLEHLYYLSRHLGALDEQTAADLGMAA